MSAVILCLGFGVLANEHTKKYMDRNADILSCGRVSCGDRGSNSVLRYSRISWVEYWRVRRGGRSRYRVRSLCGEHNHRV